MTANKPTVIQSLARAREHLEEFKQTGLDAQAEAKLAAALEAIEEAERTAIDAVCEAQVQIDRIG